MPSSNLEDLLTAANGALAAGRYKESLQFTKDALKEDKNSKEALLLVGQAAFHLKEYEQGVKAYRRILATSPNWMPAWEGLAQTFSKVGDVEGSIEAYENVLRLLSEDDGRDQKFRSRLAEAYVEAGRCSDAIQQYKQLLNSVPPSSDEYWTFLSLLADTMLKRDKINAAEEVCKKVEEKQESAGDLSERHISCLELDILASQAVRDSENSDDSLLKVLKEMAEHAPPALKYLPYREEYLRRCILRIFNAPPRTTERQHFRLTALKECVATICNGGACSLLPYEAAVWLLEEEEEITGGQVPVGGQEIGGAQTFAGGVQSGAEGHIGTGRHATVAYATENFSRRLIHQFPTNPTAKVLLALMLRRHAQAQHRPISQLQRRQLERLLSEAVDGSSDIDAASGFKALAELQYENRNYMEAKATSIRGLNWLQERRSRGHEALTQIALSLRLVYAKSLRRLGSLDEAEKHFTALAGWVTEGEAAFSEMCGSSPTSIHQQALRGLALVVLARGDVARARAKYERILGKAALGRGPAEHWAHADYGWLLYQNGDYAGARFHLEQAIHVSQEEGCAVTDSQLGEHRYRLGEVYWKLKGRYRTERQFAYSQFVEAAKVEGHAQALALAALGRYLATVEKRHDAAEQCFKKALAIDPNVDIAGEGLCDLLCNKGIDDASLTLCDEVLCRLPMTAWANRRKGLILASQGKCSDAIPFLHASIRQNPKDAVVWEAVAACYKRLQRFSAAQKSFQKALKLDPSRPFSLVQHGNILLRDERPLEALECFRNSLTINPECTLSLFGAAKSLKASAKERMSVGAVKAAVHELDAAIAYAIKIVSKKSSLITAFKLLGDLLRQRAEVSTCDRNGAKYLSGEKAKQWRERTNYVRQSRRAYIKALHLCPESASAWQDVAGCLFHDFQIQKSQDTVDALQKEAAVAVLELRKKSEWMLRGGLRLDPESPGMWSTLGVVSTKPSAQEYALSRSLQLDPSNPVAWVALAKMYLEAQEFELAEKCLQQGRAQVPTSGLIWEMMAILAAAQGDPVRAAELAEHAVGLGGGPTSLLMFAQSLIKRGKGDRGEVFVAVRRAAELCPFDPAALNALGLACEARGDKQQALNAYNAALHSLILEDTLKTEDGSSQADFVNYNIARVLVTVGRDAEALETYQRCFENNFTKVGHHSRPLSLVLDAIARLGVGDNQVAIDNLTTLLTLDGKDSLLPDPVKAAAIKVLMRAYDAMGRGDLVFDQVLSPYLSFSSAQNSIVKELLETAIKIVGSSSNGARRSMSGKEVLRLVSRHLPYDADYVGTFLYSWAVHSLKKDAKDSELSISGYCKAVHACPWSPELRTDLGNVSLRKSPYYAVNVLKFLNFPSFGVQVHAFSMANLDAALRLAFFASALVGPAPSKSIHAHMEFILGSIAQALRACPWDDDKWYMGSILATQLAGATGLQEPGSSPAWRRALSWCRGALGILNKSGTVAAALHRRSRLLICMSECTLALIRLSPLRAPGMPPLVADNQEALQLAELALQLAPSLEHRGDALRQIGRCYYHYGDLRNAEEAYKKSLAMDEKNVFGALELGRILEIKGDSASAIELLKQTASQLERFVLMPTEFLVNSAERKRHEALLELLVLNCCLALVRSGKYDEAKALLSKGRPKEAGIDPLFGSRAVVLGAIALQQARKLLSTNEVQGRAFLGEARQALGKALHPGNDATLIRILMSVLEYTGNYRKKAERIAGHAVKAIELCERPIPVYVLLILAEVSGEIIYRAKARHLVPWMSEMW